MRYTFDAEADAVFLYLVPNIRRGEVARSTVVPLALNGAAVTVALDASGHALGIEFLGASKLFSLHALEAWRDGRTEFDDL